MVYNYLEKIMACMVKHTEEVKQKLREINKLCVGEKNHYVKSNPTIDDKHNRAMVIAEARRKNGTYSTEYSGMFGKQHSEESKQKMKNAIEENGGRRMEDNPFYGKQHTEESKQKMSESHKGKTFVKMVCRFCNKLIGVNNMQKHESSCVNNPNRIIAKYNKKQ